MKFNSIGKAAHIAAAAPGGARYDTSMTHTQRSCISNGIWLCASCADKIDRDAQRYSVLLLHDWKQQAENLARSELGKPLGYVIVTHEVVDAVSCWHTSQPQLKRAHA